MAAGFKSKGAIAGERLCPKKPRRALHSAPIRWFDAQTITGTLGASAIAAHVRWAAARLRETALFSSARAVATCTVILTGAPWWWRRGIGPFERTAMVPLDARAFVMPGEQRVLAINDDRRSFLHQAEPRIYAVPREHSPAAEAR